MRFRIIAVVVGGVMASSASAQSRPQQATGVTPLGVWRGTSLCLVHPSPCHDEIVVYRIAPMKAPDSVSVDARKIVRDEEQEMGVLSCRVIQQGTQVTCLIPHGTWYFRVRRDSLVGELLLPNKTKFRDVRTARAAQ